MTQTTAAAATSAAVVTNATLPLHSIRVRENVRELDSEHVASLAQSIKLRGLLAPLIVRWVDDCYELVAGYHRIAACRSLGLSDVAVLLSHSEGSSADTAAENLTRKALTPWRKHMPCRPCSMRATPPTAPPKPWDKARSVSRRARRSCASPRPHNSSSPAARWR